MTIQVTSSAFEQGKPIPKKHTGNGPDVSPPIGWFNLPPNTKEIALICDDPDAPNGDWVHWVIYKIPANAKGLPEGVARKPELTETIGAMQGTNSWTDGNNIGYRGPLPPSGVHRYFFKVYALDAPLDVQPGLDKKGLLKKMHGHILAEGQLMGTYAR